MLAWYAAYDTNGLFFLEIVIIVMCIYKILNTCLLLAASCGTAQAQLALNVEELQPHMGRFKLDVSLAYANAQRTGLAAGSPIVVQTGPASFITLPARVGERSLNTDTVVLSHGLAIWAEPANRALRAHWWFAQQSAQCSVGSQ